MAKKQVAVSLRKPPSPEKLDAFVAAATEAEKQATPGGSARRSEIRGIKPAAGPAEPPVTIAMKEPAIAAPEPPVAMATEEPAIATPDLPPLVGADGRLMRAVTVYLPQSIAERLALHCIDLDRDMSNVVGEAVEQHLQRRLGPAAAPEGAAHGEGAATGSAPRTASPFASEWFGGAERFSASPRVERFLQMGRVLVTLWRQRPWVA